MFCLNCGKPLPDGSKFCNNCGTPQQANPLTEDSQSVINIDQSTKLVPGTCTNCGSSLQVDPSLQAAICPACGTPYIVQQAINNFNVNSSGNINIENAVINIPGSSAENYVKRAIGFEQQYELEKALEYYNKALDVDASNQDALISVSRLTEILDDFCYRTDSVDNHKGLFKSYDDKIMLKKNELIFINAKMDRVEKYEISLITDLEIIKDTDWLTFNCNGEPMVIVKKDKSFLNEWFDLLTKAKRGEYPRITKENLVMQTNYQNYHDKFTQFLSSKNC